MAGGDHDVVYEGDDAIQVRLNEADDRFTLEDFRRFCDDAWTYSDPPHFPAPGVTMPDFAQVVPYDASCHSESRFAHLVRVVAELSGKPAWVLDGNDVLWDARNVDPDRVLL